ncbi:MAG: DUF3014 domain-containing protein [Acidobacteria bacterium]|nr:DUF3014 domain-containing protein [Acidobacteriota bacterium]
MDPSEFNLDKTQEPSPGSPQRRFPVPWLIGAVAILAAGVAIWFFLSGEPAPEPADDSPPVSEAPPAPPPSGPIGVCQPPGPSADGVTDPGAAPIALPPLEASDTLVGMLAGTLSLNPQVAEWLATDDLIRNFTAVVENIANGASPAVHLGQLRPDSPFVVIPNGDGAILDPRSYSRYRPIVAAVQSIDVQAAAQLCATLKPRLDEAFAELGRNESFETALERAIVALLSAPALGENVQLVRNDDTYAFREVELESLTPAQKHLARMGAENTRAIQAALRRLALAIGIPGDRLPQPPD